MSDFQLFFTSSCERILILGVIMFRKKKTHENKANCNAQPEKQENQVLKKALDANIGLFKEIFRDDDTFVMRCFENRQNDEIKCCILFVDQMVNKEMIDENIIRPILLNTTGIKDIDILENQVVFTNNVQKTKSVDPLVQAIVAGNTVLLLDGSSEALIIGTKEWKSRALEEPEAEKTIRGSREGFIETLMVNLTLIRRRLQTPRLKFKFKTIGVETHTRVCVCYIEGIVNQKILNELWKRLDNIGIDGILGAGYISELIRDSPFSPFKTIGSTERPDIVAAKLLEGRIAVVVEGTPVVLTVPYLFNEYFQTNEDYYVNFYFSSINRILRILGFIITVSVPAGYVALMAFHQEMIPTHLLLSISSARQGVPFPTIVETILLLFVFEILRETGTRMPSNIGQALSIVGALVLGQAAVDARIMSAPVIIVVALSGITGLLIPKMSGAIIILRLIFLLLSAYLGLYGLIFGIMGFLLHLCELRSFGIPYMIYISSLNPEDLKDTTIRAPWWYMKYRPRLIAVNNRVRQSFGGSRP